MSGFHPPPSNLIPQDMRDAISKFGTDAERIVSTFAGILESYHPQPIIYHYTNDVGLRGIVESGRLWLTNIFDLNDPSELRHSLRHAVDILQKKAQSGPPESKLFARDFGSLDKGMERVGHIFTCSFSERGDDLGQWRAYADNGRGYALGFDADLLERAFGADGKTSTSNNGAFPVTYRDSSLDDLHTQLIDNMFDLISLPHGRSLPGQAILAYMVQLSVALAANVLHAGLFFKHEAYSNEKEYRFLEVHRADAAPPIKQRVRDYSLVSYREFDWKRTVPSALREIVIGPAATLKVAEEFAKGCLRDFGITGVDLTCSEIPYRSS
jgi:Protein of unknown function (DUF2971)